MKTTSYTAAKEIRIGIWLVVFTIAIFTTARIKELQLNDPNNGEFTISNPVMANNKTFPSLRILDAKLIEEPEVKIENQINSNSSEKNQELAIQMKTWLNNSSYWNSDMEETEQDLAKEMISWMNNGSYWTDDSNIIDQEVAQQMESWMTNGSYWEKSENKQQTEELPDVITENQTISIDSEHGGAEGTEKELAQKMGTWINNGTYWNMEN
jgi:hypothetical protein